MMYHHDDRDYDFAKSQAATHMRDKLHANIKAAKEFSMSALQRIQDEIPNDMIVRTDSMEFAAADSGQLEVQYVMEGRPAIEERVHPWALGQMSEYARIPKQYLNALFSMKTAEDPWGAKLAAANLNELFHHAEEKRLVRSYQDTTRGFLSTKYKRRHQGMLIDGFMNACKQYDLLPYQAQCTDTKHMVRAVLDGVFEPIKDECLGIGVVYAESPVGNGATSVSVFVERMWCTNQAVLSTDLRSMHLGGRLSDDFSWSEQTYLADTKATIHQIGDMLRAYVSPDALVRMGDTIKLAHETKIDPKEFESFVKKNMSKEDAEATFEKYRSADVEMLPAGNSVWRASNALSWFANGVGDAEKKYDVQKLAGLLLEPMSKVVAKRH